MDRYDTIMEVDSPFTFGKHCGTITDVQKFNPYHDAKGRFSTASGAASFTYKPGKSKAHDNAIARAKAKAGTWGWGWAKNPKPAPKATPAKKPANSYGDPDTVGGAKRGTPMSRDEANKGHVNPSFKKVPGYSTNCQSCVVAYEARLRGYDVTAKTKNGNPDADYLASHTNEAWIDPATGKPPHLLHSDAKTVNTPKRGLDWLENNVKAGERYNFGFAWKDQGKKNVGHIITVDRDSKGKLRLYDPQNGKTYSGQDLKDYLSRIKWVKQSHGFKFGFADLLRIDNMRINPQYADGIMEAVK